MSQCNFFLFGFAKKWNHQKRPKPALKVPISPSMPEFIGVKDRLTKLEDRVYAHDERFVQHQTLLDATSFNLKMLQVTVNEHDEKLSECNTCVFVYRTSKNIVSKMKEDLENLMKRVEELEKALKGLDVKISGIKVPSIKDLASSEGAGTSLDLSQLEGLIAKLKMELLESLAGKEEFQALLKRVESLESTTTTLTASCETLKFDLGTVAKHTNENTDEIAALKAKLKALEDKLANKVNCEDYDKLLVLINQLRASGTGGSGAAAQPAGPLIPSKDLNKIKEIAEKIPDIESRLDSLFKF